MYDIVAIGEMLIDFTSDQTQPDGYPVLAAHPGGSVANFLAPPAKYGLKTAILSKVGKDAFGALLIRTMQELGVETKGVRQTDSAFTTLAFVTRDENGDREFSFARKPGADILLTPEDIDESIAYDTRVLHFGTVCMTDEPARTTHKQVIQAAKQRGTLISFDPNLRKPLWSSLEDAKEQMLWGLSVADVVKISDNEVEFLFGLNPGEGADYLLKHFDISLLFVTLGKDGCLFASRNARGRAPNFVPAEKTVDTTGAGDIFGGSAMYQIIKRGKPPKMLTENELFEIASFACKAASLSTTKLGGISSVPDLF